MIKKNLYIFVCIFFVSTGIFAQDAWTGAKQVISIQVVNHGGFIINLDGEVDSICSHSGTSIILIYPNHNRVTFGGAKSLLSTALIAFSTGNKVNVMYSSDSSNCWGNQLLLSK